jgi:uncharacterized membrane protein YbjE (DUF340 family)
MTIFFVIGFFFVGIVVGRFFKGKRAVRFWSEKVMMWAVYLLLFLLGTTVGINSDVMHNIHNLGLQALALSFGALLGSVVLAKFLTIFFIRKKIKYGE